MPEKNSATVGLNEGEHRRQKRYRPANSTVRYKQSHFLGLFGRPSKKYLIMDISRDGMQFVSRQEFRKEARLILDIESHLLGPEAIHALARVAWVRKAPGLQAFGVGVRFEALEPPEQEKLNTLINRSNPDKAGISDSVHLKKIGKA